MISDKVFNTTGTQKIFGSDFKIISEDHLRVFLDDVVVPRDNYDLINNAAVFNIAPLAGQVITVQVGTTPADIIESPTNAGIVAANIDDIKLVSNQIKSLAAEDLTDPSSLINVGLADARYVNATGDSMTGALDMGSQRITNLPEPLASTEPMRVMDGQTLLSSNSATAIISETPPNPVVDGARWYKASEATTYVRYNDGDSSQWIEEHPNFSDLPDHVRPFANLAAAVANTTLKDGQVLNLKERTAGNGGGAMWDVVLASTVTTNTYNIVACTGVATLALVHRRELSDTIVASDFGGVLDFSTDNTAIVQACVDTLSVDPASNDSGGHIYIPRGMRFDLKALTFKLRQDLHYYLGDDSSTTQSSTKNSNEQVHLSVNANTNGIVNEEQFIGTFHPGHVVSVRKDVQGHDGTLGVGQNKLDPARASYNVRDEQQTVARTVYENYALSANIFSGLSRQNFTYIIEITGVGTDSFTTNPVIGQRINGVTSGSHGLLYEITATTMKLVWTYREFVVGENLNDGDETTTDTIATSTVVVRENQRLWQGRTEGNWTVGLPPDNTFLAPYIWGVGGKQICSIPRTAGQNIPTGTNLTETGYCWADNLELATPNGYELVYDTTTAITKRRIELKKLGVSAPIGVLGQHLAGVAIGSALTVGTSAHNVATITNSSTGNYLITFTNPAARADYRVQLSIRKITTGMNDLEVQSFIIGTASLTIRLYTRSTGALVNLDTSHYIYVDCFGGDI